MILIRPSTQADAFYVGLNLRPDDEQEVRTASGKEPVMAMLESFDHSTLCFTVWEVWDGSAVRGPIGMFGVVPDDTLENGLVWFLGTNDVERHSLAVFREAPLWLDFMASWFPTGRLFSYADARNKLHVGWCKAMGFALRPEHDKLIRNQRFLYIERTRHV